MSSTAVQGLDVNNDDLKKRGFKTLVLGVHRVIYVEPPPSAIFNPGKDVLERYKAVSQTLPSVRWFLRQIIGLAPIHCFAIVSISAITAVQQTMHTYITNRMLNLASLGLFLSLAVAYERVDRNGLSDESNGIKNDTSSTGRTHSKCRPQHGTQSFKVCIRALPRTCM
jgi:hypothetical protein